MMMQKQQDKLQADEASLMTEWRTCWQEKHAEYPYFNEDGIVDYERWITLPDGKRILVVLKETNGLQGSLVEFLRHNGNGKTWNNVVRWAKMALDGVYLEKIPQNEFQDIIRSIAVMNLKKYAGGTRANAKEIERVAHQDAYLLRQQIELYEPDILLTGGWGLTSNVLHDTICKDTTPWTRPNEQTNLWYYETDTVSKHHETLVVSMPHPNRSAKSWTLELEKVLRITGRLEPKNTRNAGIP